jgi:hypothetical protein
LDAPFPFGLKYFFHVKKRFWNASKNSSNKKINTREMKMIHTPPHPIVDPDPSPFRVMGNFGAKEYGIVGVSTIVSYLVGWTKGCFIVFFFIIPFSYLLISK